MCDELKIFFGVLVVIVLLIVFIIAGVSIGKFQDVEMAKLGCSEVMEGSVRLWKCPERHND